MTQARATDTLAPSSVRTHLDYPKSTLSDMFEDTCSRVPDKVCLDFLGATTTYRDIAAKVAKVAAGLHALGCRPGDRIAVLLPNCPENLAITLAAQRLGIAVVQHNPLYPADELEPMFLDHGARVVIAWDNALPAIMPLRARTGVQHIFGVDITRSLPPLMRFALRLPLSKLKASRAKLTAGKLPLGAVAFDTLLRHGTLPDDHPRPQPQDTAVIMYTSGTTGRPKGVPLTHSNILANCEMGKEWTGQKFGEETFLSVLPMFHAFGLTVGLYLGIKLGATIVSLPSPDPALMVKAQKRRPSTFLVAVPPLLDAFLAAAKKRKVSLTSLRASLSGAMSLPPDFVVEWEKATGGMLVEGYGLTETSPVAVGNPYDGRRRAGAIGIPFPDTQVRIVDPDDLTRDVGVDEEGELLVRGPQVFSGYLNKPEETRQAFVDGWFRTGDLVRVEDGFLVLTGRLKDIIVTGGFNVSPLNVEETLRRHPRIREVCVVGVPGSKRGEDIVAAVVPEGDLPSDEDLRAWAKEHLAAYKVPRRFVTVEALPANAMKKVVRADVVRLIQKRESGA